MKFSGSEEGWAAASHDSRREMKQKDIGKTVKAMQEATEKKNKQWEAELEDACLEATFNTVLKGGVNCTGSTAAFRRGWDRIFGRNK